MQIDKKENDERQPVILFADDDAICLDVGVKILQKLGYKVLDARDGQEAIEVFLNNQSEVNLVILDMKMPYNGGYRLFPIKENQCQCESSYRQRICQRSADQGNDRSRLQWFHPKAF